MRAAMTGLVAASVALMPIGFADAAKQHHQKYRQVQRAYPVATRHEAPAQPGLNYFGNAAAEGNNANSMSGSNSATENAIGRSNCC